MALLIICEPADAHAFAMAWALEKQGATAFMWRPAPPWALPSSMRFDSTSVDYGLATREGKITSSSIDAVWMRRWPRLVFPPGFRESEKIVSRNELRAYHQGLLELLPRSILWANPLANGRSADSKSRQLAAAVSVGLSIPRTLITDDATQAREFVDSHGGGTVIYKPFYPAFWERRDEVRETVTTIVTTADLDDPQMLVWSPGIFQTFIPKACELRVSIFGRTCISARIFDQDPIDWRTHQHDMKVGPYRLPEPVERKLLALMDELGLVMGMADFIVTPDGDHVFLEVNEQGQFLWVEEKCPELPLLDIAARFLASGDSRFKADLARGSGPSFAEFLETGLDKYREDEKEVLNSGGNVLTPMLKDHDET